MTYVTVSQYRWRPAGRRRQGRALAASLIPCALALAASAAAGFWKLQTFPHPAIAGADVSAATQPAAPPEPKLALKTNSAPDYTPVIFAQTTMLRQKFQQTAQIAPLPRFDAPAAASAPEPARVAMAEPGPAAPPALPAPPQPMMAAAPAHDLPLPEPRPVNLLGLRPSIPPQAAPVAPPPPVVPVRPAAVAAKPFGAPDFMAKLFGQPQPQGQVLAYANPDDGSLRRSMSGVRSGYDALTAIYDISAHTVYLPNGMRLEAHSGLGANFDNPRSVAQRMRGATPPNVYELTPREQLFHGVRALRLNPVGNGETYGRGGLLAHTFMLGPRGDTNGCVAFRDYKAFLQAYESGAIKRLAVVDHL